MYGARKAVTNKRQFMATEDCNSVLKQRFSVFTVWTLDNQIKGGSAFYVNALQGFLAVYEIDICLNDLG